MEMELRHLRYFVAVAETESLSLAAKSKLHTSQPSLSRQLRDLEQEIGAQLLTRTARGVALTPAGRAFLDHARGVLLQVDAAAEAARRAVHPAKPCFSMGFLTGHELTGCPKPCVSCATHFLNMHPKTVLRKAREGSLPAHPVGA